MHLTSADPALAEAAIATAGKTMIMVSRAVTRLCSPAARCHFCFSANFFHTATPPTTAASGAPARARDPSSKPQTPSAAKLSLQRAGTLLLNQPPPDYEISVHRGLKVQASLLLQRLPLVYKEPLYEQNFRLFKEDWESRTDNATVLDDEITYMQLPGHFLETQQQQEQREKQQQKTGDAELSELDMLLQQEGLVMDRHKMRKQRRKQQEDSAMSARASAVATAAAEREDRSLSQLPERVLLLLVKYGNGWQLPVEDRRHGQTMRQTLARLCMKQLGLREAPFMVGFAPAAMRKLRNKPSAVVQGREVFYYRAYHVPEQPQVCPPLDSPVRDWAWVPAEEAKKRMTASSFLAIRDALLLG
ncbi:uncharacterized protein EMH_0043010 [Eimeria mitis]|uniref:Ribosomal protein L46 N-terminal domain-containing protein n=1 Tax=Eimeria mitis TaxID=44415 RepID=U6K4U4_9EIME|nr:uncharacterized protein EMH_0043010 [Eimeria mitis]CDJ30778.1 hypothetical protein, conserved [Eimeria mitis]